MPKLENVEDRQLPRWVYAMIKANQDPNADPQDTDGPKRFLAQVKAKEFYDQRKSRLKAQADANETSRTTGLEWRNRPKTTFSAEERAKIMPGGAGYVANKTFFTMFVMLGVVAATMVTVFLGMCVCAELKLGLSAKEAWTIFAASPSGYYHHVMGAFNW